MWKKDYYFLDGLQLSLGLSSKYQFSPCTQFRLGNSKAAVHVAVDLQCWSL